MLFFLIRHAEAKREEEDPARPLSEQGRLDIRKGAIYKGASLERDGNIITANGPEAADEFGKAIMEALS